MPDPLLSYDESIAALQDRGIIGTEESPPMPSQMPTPADSDPLGLSFYRMGFENGADLSGLSIPRTFFGRSEIKDVSFVGTNLNESNLRWNDIVDVDFTGASLVGADLRASDYIRVCFDAADLCSADLRYSNYESCSFAGAKMKGALLAEDQRSELGLSRAQIEEITWQPDHGPEPSGG